MMKLLIYSLGIVTMTALVLTWRAYEKSADGQSNAYSAVCQPSGELVPIPGLAEASGVAASRKTPGVLWAHNDSAEPVIVALSDRGGVMARVRVAGAQVDDWEDLAAAPCGGQSCLYIADIGDNSGKREHVTVYRVQEPSPKDEETSPAEPFHAVYPDGPRDAESLFVTRDGGVFLITKGDPGPVALYRFPKPLRSGETMRLERVGTGFGGGKVDAKDRPTGAALSPDEQWIAVRTTDVLAIHPAADLLAGRWRERFRVDLRPLGEPQGEGVTFGASDTIFLVGEGGKDAGSGSFARMTCALK
jgi:hypothetical protein